MKGRGLENEYREGEIINEIEVKVNWRRLKNIEKEMKRLVKKKYTEKEIKSINEGYKRGNPPSLLIQKVDIKQVTKKKKTPSSYHSAQIYRYIPFHPSNFWNTFCRKNNNKRKMN